MDGAIIGGAQNIGSAISVDTAAKFVERYRLGVGEPFIGIQMVDNSATAADRYGLAVDDVGLVTEKVPGAPANEAGLEQWDVIRAIGETPMAGSADVVAAIQETLLGDTVAIDVLDDEERLTFDVVIGERPEGT